MDSLTADELWMILAAHCSYCSAQCGGTDKERAKWIYDRLSRMQEITKLLIEKS